MYDLKNDLKSLVEGLRSPDAALAAASKDTLYYLLMTPDESFKLDVLREAATLEDKEGAATVLAMMLKDSSEKVVGAASDALVDLAAKEKKLVMRKLGIIADSGDEKMWKKALGVKMRIEIAAAPEKGASFGKPGRVTAFEKIKRGLAAINSGNGS